MTTTATTTTPTGPPVSDFERFLRSLHVVRPLGYDETLLRQQLITSIPKLKELTQLDPCLLTQKEKLSIADYNNQLAEFLQRANSNPFLRSPDTWLDFGTIPPQLPYNPIPAMVFGQQIPWLCEQQVKYFNTRLQIYPYNYPVDAGTITPVDIADASAQPFNTLFQYQSKNMPPMILTHIVISALVNLDRAQALYPFDLNFEKAFFSDQPASGNEVDWYIEYLNGSTIKYTTPPEPNTYPANLLLRWNSEFKLRSMTQGYFGDNACSQGNAGGRTYPQSAYDNVGFHYRLDIPGGVEVLNGDAIAMRTGLPTWDADKVNYLKKLYVTCHFKLARSNYDNLQATKKLFAVVGPPL